MQREFLKPCYKVANAKKNVKAEFSGMALSGTALTHRFCLLITSVWWLEYFKQWDSPANSGERKVTPLKKNQAVKIHEQWMLSSTGLIKPSRWVLRKHSSVYREVHLQQSWVGSYRGSHAWTRVHGTRFASRNALHNHFIQHTQYVHFQIEKLDTERRKHLVQACPVKEWWMRKDHAFPHFSGCFMPHFSSSLVSNYKSLVISVPHFTHISQQIYNLYNL